MKTTKWFKRGTNPVHKGVYETIPCPGLSNRYQLWNGVFWGSFAGSVVQAKRNSGCRSLYQAPQWRGLEVKP